MGLMNRYIKLLVDKDVNFLYFNEAILVTRESSQRFLDNINTGTVKVLGAEGFIFNGKELVPVPDCIIDYSDGDEAKSVQFHKDIIGKDDAWQTVQYIEFITNL